MDIGKLSRGERIIGGAGVLLFVDSFLPWFRFCIGGVVFRACAHHNGWSNALSALGLLVATAMVVQIGVHHFSSMRLSSPGTISWGQAHLFAGFAVLALVVLQFLAGDSPMHRAFGSYFALVCAAGIAYGGMVRSREPEPTPEG
jgi:hypothetical protein